MLEVDSPRAASDGTACVADLMRQGYGVLEGALSTDLCDEIVAETARMAGEWPRVLQQATHGFETVRYFDLLNAAPVFQLPPAIPAVLEIVREVIGSDCLLGTYGTSIIGPGEEAQVIHADDGMYGLPRPHADMYCLVVVALGDFTEENGATRVVPFSHTFEDYPPTQSRKSRRAAAEALAAEHPSIALEMPKGSVGFVLGNTWHGGGANRSTRPRPAMTITYCSGWVRPQENFQLAVSQERAATFTPDLQALLGYRLGRGNLGHIYTADDHLTGPLAAGVRHPSFTSPPLATG